MLKPLNQQQINYILHHLSFHIDNEDFQNIQNYFTFTEHPAEINNKTNQIIFNLSPRELKLEEIIYLENIPVLFPLGQKKAFYSIEGNNLVFHHDILKSCFYLLSGYQEYKSTKKDNLGRFPYNESIQYKLGVLDKPIVNYYFEIILRGIEEFCSIHNIQFKRNNIFDNWKVMLTHDIDRIDTYALYELMFRFKQIIGLASSRYSWLYSLRLFFKYLYGFFTKRKNNPHWDFDLIRQTEKKHGYSSVFYFLPKDQLHKDSYYKFDEPRILKLFQDLHQDECEIGLHGTVKSVENYSAMEGIYRKLEKCSPQTPVGIRQHRLLFKFPETLKIQKEAGLKYDTTLGFAGHEGFRNSYCLPFKLFDFDNNQMIDTWEIPLTVMDGTLFGYRNLSVEEAKKSIHKLIQEIKKFNGTIVFLWHNGFEIDNPDKRIPKFYRTILEIFAGENGGSILGKDIIEILEEN